MLTYWETLTAIQSNVPVNDSYAQLWGRKSQGGYTVVTYIGTLPATLTGTKAGYLHRYKIYGNTEQIGTPTPENPIYPSECGERTGNLAPPLTEWVDGYLSVNGTIFAPSDVYKEKSSDYIPIKAGATYTFCIENGFPSGASYSWRALGWYTQNKTFISRSSDAASSALSVLAPLNAVHCRISYRTYGEETNPMLTEGSTVPDHYIPYGYKLPLTSAGQDVDVYIGDDMISAEEYVDSGTGKIYRMVDGVLTPTDPPLPLPQIPTSAGSTTIGWAGEGLAPSQVELEYEKKR